MFIHCSRIVCLLGSMFDFFSCSLWYLFPLWSRIVSVAESIVSFVGSVSCALLGQFWGLSWFYVVSPFIGSVFCLFLAQYSISCWLREESFVGSVSFAFLVLCCVSLGNQESTQNGRARGRVLEKTDLTSLSHMIDGR